MELEKGQTINVNVLLGAEDIMDIQLMTGNQNCFVNTLSRLRESSKDAVVSADSSVEDPYAMYMHVDRPVQEKFVSILKETFESKEAELILLCGSVGDGKSHMLSYCKAVYPEMMETFYVHNDSTASLYIDKPAAYTLMKILENFADDKIDQSDSKVVLAINLGTLNNFLEADEGGRFGKLKRYVDSVGILDETVSVPDACKHFHCVNFADYHLYELTSNGITSKYVKDILNKITARNTQNVFYSEYCKNCANCDAKDICPVCLNYQLLSDEKFQQGIVNAMVESIVKNKLIISTRTLLNMIYEIVVDERHWDRGSLEPRKIPQKMTSAHYCEALLPNTLFGKKNSSEVLEAMGSVDPMQIRNEKIDDFFVNYENSDDILDIFKKDLLRYSIILNKLKKIDFSDRSTHSVKEAILKTFVRSCWLTEARSDLLPRDEDYEEYIRALYSWNTGEHRNLKNMYNIVEKGILAWNGQVNQDEMQLLSGNKKTDFHLIQKIEIKKKIEKLPKQVQGELCSFKDELRLKYKYSGDEEAELDVDFSLYKLLKRVVNGYVPSMTDKRVNVKCVEFINKISYGGSKMEKLYIRDLSQKNAKEYRLSYDEDYGYAFEVMD